MIRAALLLTLFFVTSQALAKRELITFAGDPAGTVGRITTPRGGICTATTVWTNIVLTTARCLLDAKTNTVIDGNYQFRAVYKGQSYTAGIVRYSLGTTDYKDAANNWALLQTDTDVGLKIGSMGASNYDDIEDYVKDSEMSFLYAITYPQDLGGGRQPYLESGCQFTGTSHNGTLLQHNCTMSGTTGSPIFAHDAAADTQRIVGLTTLDGQDQQLAIPASAFFAKLKEWRAKFPRH